MCLELKTSKDIRHNERLKVQSIDKNYKDKVDVYEALSRIRGWILELYLYHSCKTGSKHGNGLKDEWKGCSFQIPEAKPDYEIQQLTLKLTTLWTTDL